MVISIYTLVIKQATLLSIGLSGVRTIKSVGLLYVVEPLALTMDYHSKHSSYALRMLCAAFKSNRGKRLLLLFCGA
jgi:hypothetical protein